MTTAAINAGFDLDLKDILPRLRIYALSLTRNKDRADDLVQQTALKALAGRASFHVGSNFGGWIFRIQHNEFISELRRNRPTVEFDSPEAYAVQEPPRQEHQLILRDVLGALRQLPRHRRQALLQSQIEGCSHREIASRAEFRSAPSKAGFRAVAPRLRGCSTCRAFPLRRRARSFRPSMPDGRSALTNIVGRAGNDQTFLA
jgi:RNA polymerase sigma-70 factor (ECF subfamily)